MPTYDITRRATLRLARAGTGDILDGRLAFPDTALARVPDGVQPDNLLLASVRNDTLELTVPRPPKSASTQDRIIILVNGVDVFNQSIADYIDGSNLRLPFTAAQRGDSDGLYTLKYKFTYYPGSGSDEGPDQSYVLDFTRPGLPFLASPEVSDPSIIEDGLLLSKLKDDGTGRLYLEVKLPGYQGHRIGDRITGLINGQPASYSWEIDTEQEGEGEDILFRYYKEDIEAAGTARVSFAYQIVDRAGNQSEPSSSLELPVLLEEITDLLPPLVPRFSDDGLIDDADARFPTEVHIPANDAYRAGDAIRITWADTELDTVTLNAADIGNDPVVKIQVPYGPIYDAWFTVSAGIDLRASAEVDYVPLRGGLTLGDAPATTVVTNLFLAGGGDPDPETPVHDNLLMPVVSGDNTITPEESQTDSDIVVPFLTKSGEAYLKEGDVLHVVYGSTDVTEVDGYVVTAADAAGPADLSFTLLQADIAAEGAGIIPAFYTVTRTLSQGGSNTSLSPQADVTVVTAGELPGEGVLEAATLEPVNEFGAVGPKEIDQGVSLVIPRYSNIREGDRITVLFELYPGLEHAAGEVALPDTRYEVNEYIVTAGDAAAADLRFAIDKKYLLAPKDVTHAEPQYTVSNAAGSVVAKTTLTMVDSRGEAKSGALARRLAGQHIRTR